MPDKQENRIRELENAHIPIWLIKDLCWMLSWKLPAMAMIIPAIGMSVFVCFLTKNNKYLLWPNIAITFWITANSIWMTGEFLNFHFKVLASIFFIAGLVAVMIYFIFRLKPVLSRKTDKL
ncbi:MAG: hypothetical protein MUC81_06325 [Bacteroidia bacterium]|jgi:hypothetical protein|nr:hypothetical protein [Bacteroidia bacterium]